MRIAPDSLLRFCAPLVGAAMLCAAVGAQADTTLRTKLQPQVTTDQTPVGFRVKSQPLPSFQPLSLDVSKFAFTAPGRGASPGRVQTVERSFSFTPSRSAKGLSIGVTARNTGPVPDRMALASADGSRPLGNSVDLSVGYKGFEITGGVSHHDTGIGGLNTEAVDIGLGYVGKKVRTGITATAERDDRMFFSSPGDRDPRYGLEANGLFALSPSVSVGGTLRYRLAPSTPTPLDPNRDDRAVILGGAVAF